MKFTPDPEIQFGTVAEIKAFQDRRLAETVGYLAGNSPFFIITHEIQPCSGRTQTFSFR